MNGTQARWRVQCFGQVQRVGFRDTARRLARRQGLTGWAENRPDGSVVLEAQGGISQLRSFFMQLKSQPHLHIEKADISILPIQSYERGFQVRSSGRD